jgi:hypothetical protein
MVRYLKVCFTACAGLVIAACGPTAHDPVLTGQVASVIVTVPQQSSPADAIVTPISGAAALGGAAPEPPTGEALPYGPTTNNLSINKHLNAVFVGNDPEDLAAYEDWLGQAADGVQLHTGRSGWSDWLGSIGWLAERWRGVSREKFWSIPLMAEGAALKSVASGTYDSYYQDAARELVANSPGSRPIYIRTGWEFNGNWQPWAGAGEPETYKQAFRRFVSQFRSVSSRFVFEWAPNIGDHGMNPEAGYPGDDVVDIIGLDFYYDRQWDPQDATTAWAYMLNRKYGLVWHRDFAAAHSKPIAYAEWGIKNDNDAIYINKAAEWFLRQDLVYQSYWNSNADYPGKLSDNQYPSVTRSYRAFIVGHE